MQPVKQLILTLFTLCILTGCIPGGSSSTEPDPANLVSLKVNVGMAEMGAQTWTRAITEEQADKYFYNEDASAAENDGEKMQTLRIVILRPSGSDWIVEHNKFIDFYGRAYTWYGWEEFKVVPNEPKKIYLFVNEKGSSYYLPGATASDELVSVSTEALFSADVTKGNYMAVGQKFDATTISNLLLRTEENTETLVNALPMSESYNIPTLTEDKEMTFLVTRAAVKFTYILKNEDSKPLTWQGLTIEKMSRREYYMPRGVTYEYKDASGNVITDAFDPDIATGKITAYDVPNVENNNYYIFTRDITTDKMDTRYPDYTATTVDGKTYPVIAYGKEVKLQPFYLLEGKYTDADSGGKNYKTSITVNGIDLEAVYFPNNKDLPRNTHVVVYITVGKDYEMNCEVDVRPYGEVILEPEFGI